MDKETFFTLGSDKSLYDALLLIDKKKLCNRRDLRTLGVGNEEINKLIRLDWIEKHSAPIEDFDEFHQTACGMKVSRKLKRFIE